jgi:hypothetical protein
MVSPPRHRHVFMIMKTCTPFSGAEVFAIMAGGLKAGRFSWLWARRLTRYVLTLNG